MCLIKNSYTTCKNGHEFTKENTYVAPHGYRNCKKCMRAARKRWYRNQRNKNIAA